LQIESVSRAFFTVDDLATCALPFGWSSFGFHFELLLRDLHQSQKKQKKNNGKTFLFQSLEKLFQSWKNFVSKFGFFQSWKSCFKALKILVSKFEKFLFQSLENSCFKIGKILLQSLEKSCLKAGEKILFQSLEKSC